MKQLFTPAIALMNRLSYPRKFALISLLLVAPLALALTLLILSIDSGVEVARLELQGDAYLRPLRKLMEHTLKDKMLANDYLFGDTALHKPLVENQAQIDRDFQDLRAVDQQFGADLQTSAQLQALE